METSPSPSNKPLSEKQIVLYDGVCNLCDFAVRFILTRDPRGRFQFASLQGDFARSRGLGTDGKLPPHAEALESIILLSERKTFRYSSAILKILGGLSFPWNLFAVFRVIPSPIRDGIYRFIARNRYRWFGHQDACILPASEWRSRFLD